MIRRKESQKPAKSENRERTQTKNRDSSSKRKTSLKIISLGGLNEIGKNMYVYECGNDMFVVDCGLAFPDQDMPGVDIVIANTSYIEKHAAKLRGVLVTHGHEDHIGAIPYFLKNFDVPIYATRLTIGLIEGKLKEHGLLKNAKLNIITHRQTVKLGCMTAEAIRVNHSIPDSVAFAIHTPAGVVVHTGDFKMDYSPIKGGIIDLARFAELGNKGVLALLSDSTNSERPGYTMSESKVGESFQKLFVSAGNRRIIIASFASNIHRVQQIVDTAAKLDRKVALSGRSMINVVSKAIELGYLSVPKGVLVDIDDAVKIPHEKIIIVTTGSQGEPMSALSRMAANDHKDVSVTEDDFIIISATPIPGNEKNVTKVVNDLLRLGAKVIYETMYEVHVSGHACQDELKLMLTLTKPRYLIPVHGEYKHLKRHGEIAVDLGMAPENIHVGEIGQVIEIDNVDMRVTGTVPAGQVMVDGLGVGDVGSIVLRDRRILSQEGLIIVVSSIHRDSGKILSGPDIVSRGFVYVRESEELMDEARAIAVKITQEHLTKGVRDWAVIKQAIRDEMGGFIYRRTKRSPMILPVIMVVN
ncbi:MAG: ribonuclease J [Oscillospiraceae bacterium]|nr:ribonuclease J [Oscillospiraceae bacterium]